jgi:hypothetical protein
MRKVELFEGLVTLQEAEHEVFMGYWLQTLTRFHS